MTTPVKSKTYIAIPVIMYLMLLLPITSWASTCPSPESLQFKARGIGCSITANSGGLVFNGGNSGTTCPSRVVFSAALWPSVNGRGLSCVYKGTNGIGYTLILNTPINTPTTKHWFCNSEGGKATSCKCNSSVGNCSF